MDAERAAVGQWVDLDSIEARYGTVKMQAMNVHSGIVLRHLCCSTTHWVGELPKRVDAGPLVYVPGNAVLTDGTLVDVDGPSLVCVT
jgi:hypothetical protein